MSDVTALVVAVVLLAANAFFVGAEFALISARRTQIEPRVLEGSRRARITLKAMENVSLVMAGAQLGITACSLGLGAVGEPAVAHLLEPGFHALGVPDAWLHPVAFVVANAAAGRGDARVFLTTNGVDPLSLLQISLLRCKRARCEGDDGAKKLDHALGTTLNGIAQGLRNTG